MKLSYLSILSHPSVLLHLPIMLFISSIGQTAQALQIYKWTDNKGIIHFSDIPPPSQASEQEKITLPAIKKPKPEPKHSDNQQVEDLLTTTTGSTNSTLDSVSSAKEITNTKAEQKKKTITVTLTNLQNEQTIRSNRGHITIQGELSRELKSGEALQLIMNTQPYGAPQTLALWELQNIDRGSHTFSIKVIESGKIIASSKTITVHLHRTTVK